MEGRVHTRMVMMMLCISATQVVSANADFTEVVVAAGESLAETEGEISITGASGDVLRSADVNFTYLAVPSISFVDPVQGQGGTVLTITGQNLLGGGSTFVTVTVAGVPARIANQSGKCGGTRMMYSVASPGQERVTRQCRCVRALPVLVARARGCA
eukprot:m.1625605 g.1625605  ORF g.1625605 m.1625605 type:complete len:157 (+) comp25394_c1_seq1:536-1006(+)